MERSLINSLLANRVGLKPSAGVIILICRCPHIFSTKLFILLSKENMEPDISRLFTKLPRVTNPIPLLLKKQFLIKPLPL